MTTLAAAALQICNNGVPPEGVSPPPSKWASQSRAEYRSQMSTFAILTSPLILARAPPPLALPEPPHSLCGGEYANMYVLHINP